MAKTKYKDEVTDKKVFLLARDKGLNKKQLTKALGITKETFYIWVKKYPSFSNAIEKGQELGIDNVVNAMYKSAIGYFIEEGKQYVQPFTIKTEKKEEKDEEGKPKITIKKIVQYKKWIPGSNVAQFFITTNKRPAEWKHRSDFEAQVEILDESINRFCDTIIERDLKDV